MNYLYGSFYICFCVGTVDVNYGTVAVFGVVINYLYSAYDIFLGWGRNVEVAVSSWKVG